MDPRVLSRRQFVITGTTAVACAGALPLATAAMATPIQRKDIRDLSSDELDKYREAFRRLKAIGPDRPIWMGPTRTMPNVASLDKKGYAFQASLHTTDCPHGNWWFLPWHRVYLYYFERILRNVVNDYKPSVPLAIPYWDWTTQRDIPGEFTTDPATNSLFDDRRFVQALANEDVGAVTITRTVDQANSFESFGSQALCAKRAAVPGSMSQFEAGPHGMVHVKIGWFDAMTSPRWPFGRPGTFRDPPTAAYDPVFWSHHANIDRLWDYWLTITGHSNPSFAEPCPDGSVTWGGLRFKEFVDVGGLAIDRSVEEFLTDPVIQSVVYLNRGGTPIVFNRGEDQPMKMNRELFGAELVGDARPVLQLGKAITLAVAVSERSAPHVRAAMADDAAAPPLMFEIQGVEIPSSAPPVLVRAFLNKPDATAATATDDPHYVGYFTFFDTGHAHANNPDDGHAAAGAGFLLNLTPTIQALGKEFDPKKPLSVSLVLLPISDKAQPALQQLQIPFGSCRLSVRPQAARR